MKHTLKEIFELGDKHMCEELRQNAVLYRSEEYIAAAPDMEAWLREVVELLPDIEKELELFLSAQVTRKDSTKDTLKKLEEFMKRAGIKEQGDDI